MRTVPASFFSPIWIWCARKFGHGVRLRQGSHPHEDRRWLGEGRRYDARCRRRYRYGGSPAALLDPALEHGPLEALFTVDEETGLTGAFGLGKGMLTGRYLVNLDSEDEGEIFIGCAGGVDTLAMFRYKTEAAPEGHVFSGFGYPTFRADTPATISIRAV